VSSIYEESLALHAGLWSCPALFACDFAWRHLYASQQMPDQVTLCSRTKEQIM